MVAIVGALIRAVPWCGRLHQRDRSMTLGNSGPTALNCHLAIDVEVPSRRHLIGSNSSLRRLRSIRSECFLLDARDAWAGGLFGHGLLRKRAAEFVADTVGHDLDAADLLHRGI